MRWMKSLILYWTLLLSLVINSCEYCLRWFISQIIIFAVLQSCDSCCIDYIDYKFTLILFLLIFFAWILNGFWWTQVKTNNYLGGFVVRRENLSEIKNNIVKVRVTFHNSVDPLSFKFFISLI